MLGLLMLAWPAVSSAQDATPRVLDIIWLVLAAALVFFMQAGFALLEGGMSRSKNAVNVVMKNYLDVCIGTLCFSSATGCWIRIQCGRRPVRHHLVA